MTGSLVEGIKHQKKVQEAKEKIITALLLHNKMLETRLLTSREATINDIEHSFAQLCRERSQRRWKWFNILFLVALVMTITGHWRILSVPAFFESAVFILGALTIILSMLEMADIFRGRLDRLKFLYYSELVEADRVLRQEYGAPYLYKIIHEGGQK